MHIGFDAKRIFFNRSGLGNYSRSTVDLLARCAPEHSYTLFSPRREARVAYTPPDGVDICYPRAADRLWPSVWRSYGMHRDIRRQRIDLYHGLSNELPADIGRSGARSVVTIHDLIFLQHPELYKPVDVKLYAAKYGRSCRLADRIVAISRATADALVSCWHIPVGRIEVVYQGCDPQFLQRASETRLQQVRERYRLPDRYLLTVGTMEPRKNLMLIVRAMHIGHLDDIHLVACGRPTPYLEQVRAYVAEHRLSDRVHLVHDAAFADLPAIYQQCEVFIYPSFIEGFGIPIVEALSSGVPVVTTRGGVFGETGGDACRYVNPERPEELAGVLREIMSDGMLRQQMTERGRAHIRQFAEPVIAGHFNDLYRELLRV